MTVSRMRNELTDAEFAYYAAFYELKNEREQRRCSARRISGDRLGHL